MKGHSKTSHRLFIDFQYQSINKYRLVLIDIDTHRFHRLSTPGLFDMPSSTKSQEDVSSEILLLKQHCGREDSKRSWNRKHIRTYRKIDLRL
jgi:hypothetical protein